jgi:hypothetical protein
MIKLFGFILALIVTIFLVSCDKGIEPLEVAGPSAFSGRITFDGNWPEGIKRTHLVVFKEEIKTVADFFLPNLSFVVDSIPYGAKEYAYNSLENPYTTIFKLAPGTYKYVVVAQSKTPELTFNRADWTVVGIYCESEDQSKPKTMVINPGKTTTGINIKVNFNSLPPQPPM